MYLRIHSIESVLLKVMWQKYDLYIHLSSTVLTDNALRSLPTFLLHIIFNPHPFSSILFILIHSFPSSSILFHLLPYSSILIHFLPSSSIIFHPHPFSPIIFHPISSSFFLFPLLPFSSILWESIIDVIIDACQYHENKFRRAWFYNLTI